MKKASEYRQHGKECRELAARSSNSEHRAAMINLIKMAETWDKLARNRAAHVARLTRIEALTGSPRVVRY